MMAHCKIVEIGKMEENNDIFWCYLDDDKYTKK